jgi:acyl-CoA thioester hydrolase
MSTRPTRYRRDDFKTLLAMTTRWRDNDAYGHLNNTVYNEYFDTALNQVLIEAGVLDLERSEVIGLVVHSFAHYFASVSYPEKVTLGVGVTRIGRSSVNYEFALFREDDKEAAAQGGLTHVYVDRATRRPAELPAALRSLLETLTMESPSITTPSKEQA